MEEKAFVCLKTLLRFWQLRSHLLLQPQHFLCFKLENSIDNILPYLMELKVFFALGSLLRFGVNQYLTCCSSHNILMFQFKNSIDKIFFSKLGNQWHCLAHSLNMQDPKNKLLENCVKKSYKEKKGARGDACLLCQSTTQVLNKDFRSS